MSEGFISRGFRGRRRQTEEDTHIPPGQYLVDGFPVLSAGPTPRTPLEEWDFSIVGEVDEPKKWTWEEFRALPSERFTTDIHCATCDNPLIRISRGRGRYWLDLRGVEYLQIDAEP